MQRAIDQIEANRGARWATGTSLAVVGLLLSSLSGLRSADSLEVASPFVDGAVLQRGMGVPVWGWASPGSVVAVSFAGQTKKSRADAIGSWRVTLDALEASRVGRVLSVSSGAEAIALRRVLVGEVWLSSGQSNMDWVAGKSMCRDLASAIRRLGDVPIREYVVDAGSSLFPRSRAMSKDGWKLSDRAGEFSALSLAFAWALYEELGVPIGILRATHGATPVETWTAYEGFVSHPDLQEIARRVRESRPTSPESRAAYSSYFSALESWREESAQLVERGGQVLPRPKLPGIADDWKGPTRMFNKKIAPLVPYAVRGAIWCQGTHNAGDGKIYAAKMAALVDGWRLAWKRPELPFYFTQMQCYGEPDPNQVGFADIREAQTLFFLRAKNVGMVPQYDLNPARPTGIHYHNKLDPGERLARWALAHEYGRRIAYAGPIYTSHRVDGDTLRVRFEQRGPGGGLMVGSKGLESDGPEAYVEPARATPGEPLRTFRLAGADKVWHDAEAVIQGDEVVVRSRDVPSPRGVQYAYSATPIGANLYNRAGLPALPFAYFDGRQMFNEDDPKIVAAARAEAERKWGKRSYLLPSTLFRDRVVLQRDLHVPVWGHGVPGTEITVRFGNQQKRTNVDEFERWRVTLDPMAPSATGRDLAISCSNGESRTIRDVWVGDVWVLTGARQLSTELMRKPVANGDSLPALPQVREFRIKTKARRFRTPRKLRMEIGGGRYVASWQPADFDESGDLPSVAAYHFARRSREAGVPVGIVTLGAENPPLTWISYDGLQTAKGFEKERDELNLAYPNTDVCKQAVVDYIDKVRGYNREVAALLESGREVPDALADQVPPFPEPYHNQWVSRTETATHTYNFCISPLTPFAVRGVVWMPGPNNVSKDVTKYSPALEAYAKSLPRTYGQADVSFLYAHPSTALVEGVGVLDLPGSPEVELISWPRSYAELATELGTRARESRGRPESSEGG